LERGWGWGRGMKKDWGLSWHQQRERLREQGWVRVRGLSRVQRNCLGRDSNPGLVMHQVLGRDLQLLMKAGRVAGHQGGWDL